MAKKENWDGEAAQWRQRGGKEEEKAHDTSSTRKKRKQGGSTKEMKLQKNKNRDGEEGK